MVDYSREQLKKDKSLIGKEVFIGLVSLALGTYNVLGALRIIEIPFDSPEIVAYSLLILCGFFLLTQAFKLAKHEYHLRRIF